MVAEKTERVYADVVQMPRLSILSRMKLKLALGPVSGIGNILLGLIWLIVLCVVEIIWPRESIDIADDFNFDEYKANPEKYGDHKFKVKDDITEASKA